jgi:hypothetical protein
MESTKQLKAFSTDAVGELVKNVEANQKLYCSAKSWAEGSLVKLPKTTIPTNLILKNKIELKLGLPQEKTELDRDNAIQLHQCLIDLTPVQARDSRLWTFLAHETCWEYMRSRWPVTTRANSINYIKEHYFVTTQQSRALIRHGIARLWWYGHLTFDETRTNPYQLTHILLKTLDITASILERNLGKNRLVRTTLLDFLLMHEDVFLQKGERSKNAVRSLVKSLNLRGGSAILDAMPKSSLEKFLANQLTAIEREVM